MTPRILVVAGSDSGGGAGIQADIRTVSALGGHAMTAVTALTAQDTTGVHGVVPTPPRFVALQIATALADLGADAIKTGMLVDAATIDAVADALGAAPEGVPLVVDPVMVAKGGHRLLEDAAVERLLERLAAGASVVTPNLPEAELLLGTRIADLDAMQGAAVALRARTGARAILLKGGHLAGDRLTDLLATDAGLHRFEDRRIATPHTHGTGCTLASALATWLGRGVALEDAVARARAHVRASILAAPGFGHGHGPLGMPAAFAAAAAT